jgi:predicted nucleotidyltransferase
LEDIVARLGRHPAVAGLLSVGSAVTGEFGPVSDHDLVVVLHDSPRAWYVGVAWIAGRLADLLFVALDAVRSVGTKDIQLSSGDELEPVARWVSEGRILADPGGVLAATQARLQGVWPKSVRQG